MKFCTTLQLHTVWQEFKPRAVNPKTMRNNATCNKIYRCAPFLRSSISVMSRGGHMRLVSSNTDTLHRSYCTCFNSSKKSSLIESDIIITRRSVLAIKNSFHSLIHWFNIRERPIVCQAPYTGDNGEQSQTRLLTAWRSPPSVATQLTYSNLQLLWGKGAQRHTGTFRKSTTILAMGAQGGGVASHSNKCYYHLCWPATTGLALCCTGYLSSLIPEGENFCFTYEKFEAEWG